MTGSGGRAGPALSRWGLVLGAVTILRAVVAARTPLSPDEAYYWVWSRALAPGYLDHPPMVALWIRAGTALLGNGALGVRLLAPLSAAVGTLFLAMAARDLGHGDGPAAGRMVRAGVLLNATLALGIGAVTMTPDTPLLFFMTLALWALGRLLATGRGGWWLVLGTALGLACDSKYTAVLPGGGLALWCLCSRSGRAWLRTPWPWCGAALAAILFLPVIGWNHAHHWASFVRQGGRAGDWRPARAVQFLSELVGGQVGLMTPLIALAFGIGLWRAWRRADRDPGAAVLLWWIVPPALVFAQHALGDRVQANWPVLLYPALAVLAASPAWRFWRAGGGLGFALTLLVYVQSTLAPFSLSPHLDITLRQMAGWQELARAVDSLAAPGEIVAADEYGLASELALALPRRTVIGIEPRWALFDLPRPPGGSGLFLCSVRRLRDLDLSPFGSATRIGTVERTRRGHVAERYAVFRVTLTPAPMTDAARLPAGK
ncbi:ArnT family glycosyltransferase [Gluconacetobacter takamatsuzukensis]|uniref:ArnT family glycosyltransferase n=1 Tax=Gluconacetobacter takamatsuzukensis TaxID=1286190 RepID=UPI001FE4AC55|nr:glycosyltransferase family 39 protein [Gluconacetobacter takamatsuzukensis]